MGRREDFYSIINHKQPEKLIVDLGGNPLSSMEGNSMYKLMELLGYEIPEQIENQPFGKVRKLDEKVLRYFNIDTRSVGSILHPNKSQYKKISDNEYIDEWGIKRKFTGMYWENNEFPLKGATREDLYNYSWPDPDYIDEGELEACEKQAKYLFEETDYIVCAEHPVYGIFELGCWMCGFDDFLLKIALDKDFIKSFFEIVLNYQKKVIEKYYGRLGKYIHYTSSGDDFATQESLFISPDSFRELVKPFFKERINYTKSFTNAAYLHHSCGSVFPIIEDLIDSGVEILNPVQPKARDMGADNLKQSFGNKIVFHGGFDTQDILPFGTKASIEEEVSRITKILNKNGGYIFATSHNIQEDVPPENIVYLFEAVKKLEI